MKIIYYHYYGTYFSIIAASIHLKILPKERFPDINTIYSLPNFGHKYVSFAGNLLFAGTDENHNEIYALGCKSSSKVIMAVHESMNKIYGNGREELIYRTTIKENVLYLKILNKMSMFTYTKNLAEEYFARYLKNNYMKIAKKVLE